VITRPLRIYVTDALHCWPEIQKLEAQGHDITSEADNADLVLGPNCWCMDDLHRQYLPLAIKAARIRKYGPSSKQQAMLRVLAKKKDDDGEE